MSVSRPGGLELGWDPYAIYWADRAGESGPVETDMSACEKYLEVMLPVDDLKGASRAIAAYPGSRSSREPGAGWMSSSPAGKATKATHTISGEGSGSDNATAASGLLRLRQMMGGCRRVARQC